MKILAELALILVGSAAIGVAVASALLVALRRMSRVSVRHPAPASLRWMVLPSRSASMHRRLRNSTIALRTAVPAPRRRAEPTTVQEMAEDVEALAAATDRAILIASRARSGRSHFAQLDLDVRRIEEMVRRLCDVAAELEDAAPGTAGWERRADRVEETIRSHEFAIEELRHVATDRPVDSADSHAVRTATREGTR